MSRDGWEENIEGRQGGWDGEKGWNADVQVGKILGGETKEWLE